MKKNVVVIMFVAILLLAACSNSKDIKPSGDGKIAWPERPIQFVVGANAGGGIDTAARLMAKYLEKELGKPIVVSNIPGGAGSVAARQVRSSAADGYTAFVSHEALLTNKIAGTTEFDYDGFTSGGVGLKVFSTSLLSKEYATFEQLIEAAKANPGKIRFGTEAATNDTAIIALIENEFGVKIQVVDTGAVSDQIGAMMGGHIDFMKAPAGLTKDYISSGDFHILGFFNEERIPAYPDVPTMKELGVNLIVDKFYYIGFPEGTDQQIIEKFSAALKKVTEDTEYIDEANKIDYVASYVSPADIPSYFEQVKSRLLESQKLIDQRGK